MNRIILLLTTLVISVPVSAQLEIDPENDQPIIPTWESYECMKYGTVGASLYTGTVNYSIPLYTYKDHDFEIPISLEYATNGFRVNHSSGQLGHGWALSNFGRITRKVKGIPDEKTITTLLLVPQTNITNYSCFDYPLHGYSSLNRNIQYKKVPVLQVLRNQFIFTLKDPNAYIFYENEPDEFSFDFCGYSGSFHSEMNCDGADQKFILYDASGNSRGLKIRFIEDPDHNDPFDMIEITDTKGYVYTFSTIEYTLVNLFQSGEGMNPDPSNDMDSVVLSWGIQKIKAPNGRAITFKYSRRYGEHYSQVDNKADDKIYNPILSYYFSVTAPNDPPVISDPNDSYHREKIYKRDLTSIEFADSSKVLLSRTAGQNEIVINRTELYDADIDHRKLDYIKVISNQNTIKYCKFDYDTTKSNQNDGNRVTFLKSVDISGIGKYTFNYNNKNGRYPYLGTGEYDHWGYYNGEDKGFPLTGFRSIDSIFSYDSVGNESMIQSIKAPSFSDAVSGTLCRISYPTGGFSTIEYEPHSYSRDVIRTSNSEGDRTHYPFFQPTLRNLQNNEITGGVRVKRIITHLSDSLINDTTSFDYSLDCNSELSSGIMITSPRYGIEYQTTDRMKVVKSYNLSNSMFDFGSTHIEYSHVKKYNSGQGFVAYDFSTSNDEIDREYGEFEPDYVYDKLEPDSLYGDISRIPLATWWMPGQNDIHSCIKPIEMALTPMASFQTKRGKLLKESYYNAEGKLIQEKNYTYNYPLIYVDTVWHVVAEVAKRLYAPRFDVELINTTSTDYSGNVAISKAENYTYNDLGLTTSVTTNTSDGSSLRTNLYYVCDSMSNSGVIADMAESHNLAQLLKKEQYKVSNGIEKLVSAERLEYYHPDSNNLALACPIAKYSWLNGQQWKLAESYQYDDKGNLVELTDTRGVSDSYLWGYHGRYLVGQVKNLSLSALSNSLMTSPSLIRDMATLPDDEFNELKNLSLQPSSLLSLYRYIPGVGLTETVAPNLSKTVYQYNGYGKLNEIRDNDGRIIEQYDYNIITIEPLSASLVCDVSCYKNNELIASVKCNGGSGVYSYIWAIVKANGDTVNVLDNDTTITISPIVLNLLSGQNCTIECTVHDMVSGETVTSDQTVYVKPAILRFENIVESVNPSNSSAIITASIYCDNNVSAQFCFERICTGQCSVSVGNSSYSNFVNKTTYFYMPLHPGWNNVTMSVSNAETAEVELSIVSAAGHDIGQPSSISAQI